VSGVSIDLAKMVADNSYHRPFSLAIVSCAIRKHFHPFSAAPQ